MTGDTARQILSITLRKSVVGELSGIREVRYGIPRGRRLYTDDARRGSSREENQDGDYRSTETTRDEQEDGGAMSRRLEEMTTRSLQEGGSGAKQSVTDAGFSEDLKRRLEERIQSSQFRSENAAAFAQVEMPNSAGKVTRDIAAAESWTGTESNEDAVLRMLNDAHKPLKGAPSGKVRLPQPKGQKTARGSQGRRLANARDRTSVYASAKDENLSDAEREQMKKEMRDRFTLGARPMPTSVQGLASLANERIENAIARGQFNNIPRGKAIERDYNASSPFLDTTEYFMNKIIQKQEIVPPWIEKQQELVKVTDVFRRRLRTEWRRHAARLISSRGGTLEEKMRKAEAYAEAEKRVAPSKPTEGLQKGSIEALATTDLDDEETLAAVTAANTITDPSAPGADAKPPSTVTTTVEAPLRDTQWEATERSYHELAIANLNSIARSYNLMAPELAKKPYFALERELRACFADVAPQLASEIHQRSQAPTIKMEKIGHRPGGVLEKFGAGESASVYDSRKPHYGFKDFWRDLFSQKA